MRIAPPASPDGCSTTSVTSSTIADSSAGGTRRALGRWRGARVAMREWYGTAVMKKPDGRREVGRPDSDFAAAAPRVRQASLT